MTVRFLGVVLAAFLLSAGAVCAQQREPRALGESPCEPGTPVDVCRARAEALMSEEGRRRAAEADRRAEEAYLAELREEQAERERAAAQRELEATQARRLAEMEARATAAQAEREARDRANIVFIRPNFPVLNTPDRPLPRTTRGATSAGCGGSNNSPVLVHFGAVARSQAGYTEFEFMHMNLKTCADGRTFLAVMPSEYSWNSEPDCDSLLSRLLELARENGVMARTFVSAYAGRVKSTVELEEISLADSCRIFADFRIVLFGYLE